MTGYNETAQTVRTRELIRTANGSINPDAKEAMNHVLDTAEEAIQPDLSPEDRAAKTAIAVLALANAQSRHALSARDMVAAGVKEHSEGCPGRARSFSSVKTASDALSWANQHRITHSIAIAALVMLSQWLERPNPQTAAALAKLTRQTAATLADKTEGSKKAVAKASDDREARIIQAVEAALDAEDRKGDGG